MYHTIKIYKEIKKKLRSGWLISTPRRQCGCHRNTNCSKALKVATCYLQIFTKDKYILSREELLDEEAVLGSFSTADYTGRKSAFG